MGKAVTAVSALLLCLVLGGLPVSAQEASRNPGATMVSPVSGTLSVWYMSFWAASTIFATNPDDALHPRDATFGGAVGTVSATTDDPRVNGNRTLHWNQDRWGDVANGPLAAVQWGTARIENAGGAWEGTGSGVYSSDRGDIIALWYKGSGGYAGLGYFELLTRGTAYRIRGMIFPGDPPDLSGMPPVTDPQPTPNVPAGPTAAPIAPPTAIAYGPTSAVTGTSAYTVVDFDTTTMAGIDTTNDPRVSGEFLAPSWAWDFMVLPGYDYGMGPQWGPSRLANAGGTWQGVGSGVFDGSDAIVIWYKGTGGYAGLSYFQLLIRSDWFGPTGGDVVTGVFGLVFPGDPPTP